MSNIWSFINRIVQNSGRENFGKSGKSRAICYQRLTCYLYTFKLRMVNYWESSQNENVLGVGGDINLNVSILYSHISQIQAAH